MKKLLCILLAAMLLLSLCACGSSEPNATTEAKEEKCFKVGYAQTDITPKLDKYSVGLRGFGDTSTRIAKDIISYIYSTCLAVQDEEGNTAVLISLDVCSLGSAVQTEVREVVSKKVKLPIENVVVSCAHQHSSPEPATSKEWTAYLQEQVAESARLAIEDLAPATMETTSVMTENLNFVRHYEMNDGTYQGDNFGSTKSGFKKHVSDADPEMQLVKFVREGNKTILLANFQGHPHLGATANYNSVHSDTVGVFRDTVKETLGYEVIYFSGAGGNLKMKSSIEEENLTTDFREHGKMLARYAMGAEGTYTAAQIGKLQCMTTQYVATVDHSNDHLYDLAVQVDAVFKETGSASEAMSIAGAKESFSSVHQASSIVSLKSYDDTRTMEHLGAISFGDVAFVAAPYEMFDQNGVFIKDESPFAMTIISTIANSGYGYMPSEFTYTYGGYEVDTSKYVKGTAEELAQTFVDMLNQLHGN